MPKAPPRRAGRAAVAWRPACDRRRPRRDRIGGLLAAQAVYFIGTDDNGQVTVFNGLPFALPAACACTRSTSSPGSRSPSSARSSATASFNNELRSQESATHLVSQLELDQIAGQ